MTEQDLRPPRQQRAREQAASGGTTRWLLLVLAVAAIGYGAWFARERWAAQQRTATPAVQESAPPPVAEAMPPQPQAQVAEPAPEAEEAPLHPVLVSDPNALAADDAQGLDRLVVEWLGQQALKFVVTPGLAHHIVATVDNLPRGHAAPRLWPLSPVGGQMALTSTEQGAQIAAANSARYDALVGFVTSIEPSQAAQWYRQAYPALQQAYENLGYPGQYFNDRLIAVIDHLLRTPQPTEPLAVRWVQVQGQVAPQQPWLRYEYADADLQALSAGQKILLRLGTAHRQRIQSYLQALRSQIAT